MLGNSACMADLKQCCYKQASGSFQTCFHNCFWSSLTVQTQKHLERWDGLALRRTAAIWDPNHKGMSNQVHSMALCHSLCISNLTVPDCMAVCLPGPLGITSAAAKASPRSSVEANSNQLGQSSDRLGRLENGHAPLRSSMPGRPGSSNGPDAGGKQASPDSATSQPRPANPTDPSRRRSSSGALGGAAPRSETQAGRPSSGMLSHVAIRMAISAPCSPDDRTVCTNPGMLQILSSIAAVSLCITLATCGAQTARYWGSDVTVAFMSSR